MKCLDIECNRTSENNRFARGYCTLHYQRIRAREKGIKQNKRHNGDDWKWLYNSLDQRNRSECWIDWPYSVDKGYPYITRNSRSENVSRVVLQLVQGDPPNQAKNNALHKCGVSFCVNPNHLYWGTHADNGRDMVEHGRSARRITDEEICLMFYSEDRIKDIAEKFGVYCNYVGQIKRIGRALLEFENLSRS
jgi:hypothetical protein